MTDNEGKYSIMFACRELISEVVAQGGEELHADGTFNIHSTLSAAFYNASYFEKSRKIIYFSNSKLSKQSSLFHSVYIISIVHTCVFCLDGIKDIFVI